MKHAFLLLAGVFIILYVAAQETLEWPPHDGVVRLRWATDANPARPDQVSGYSKMFPGAEVRVDPGLGGDQTKLIVQCATGTGPDVVDVYDKQQMATLVDAGVLLDLTPYAKAGGFDPSRTYPALKQGLLVQGKQYRFPCNVWANCVVYNRKVFDDLGVAYPKPGWSYDDFLETGRQLREHRSRSGQKHIVIANFSNTWFYGDLLVGYGGRRFSPDGLVSALDSKAAIDAMNFYHDLMFKYKLIPTAAEAAAMSSQGGWGSSGLNWFSSGKAAMIFIGRWYIIQVPNFPDLKGNLGCTLLPRVGNRPSAGMTDTRAAGVNVKSPHRKEALNFLRYLASPEYGRIIVKDGDSLPPSPVVARNGKDLATDMVPDPAFHQPFVDAMRNAVPVDVSPFIDAGLAQRWLGETIDKVENQVLQPEPAMRQLADSINQEIRVNLERRPDLQRKYEEVTGRKYDTEWWRSYEKRG